MLGPLPLLLLFLRSDRISQPSSSSSDSSRTIHSIFNYVEKDACSSDFPDGHLCLLPFDGQHQLSSLLPIISASSFSSSSAHFLILLNSPRLFLLSSPSHYSL